MADLEKLRTAVTVLRLAHEDYKELVLDLVRQVTTLEVQVDTLQHAISRLDEGMNGPPGRRLSLETIAKRLEKLAERG